MTPQEFAEAIRRIVEQARAITAGQQVLNLTPFPDLTAGTQAQLAAITDQQIDQIAAASTLQSAVQLASNAGVADSSIRYLLSQSDLSQSTQQAVAESRGASQSFDEWVARMETTSLFPGRNNDAQAIRDLMTRNGLDRGSFWAGNLTFTWNKDEWLRDAMGHAFVLWGRGKYGDRFDAMPMSEFTHEDVIEAMVAYGFPEESLRATWEGRPITSTASGSRIQAGDVVGPVEFFDISGQMVLGHGNVFIPTGGGTPVVVIIDRSPDDFVITEGTPVEDSQNRRLYWQYVNRNPDTGEMAVIPDPRFVDGNGNLRPGSQMEATVLFSPTQERLNEALVSSGWRLGDDEINDLLDAGVIASQQVDDLTAVTELEGIIEDAFAQLDLAEERDPSIVRVLYDRNGRRIRQLGLNEEAEAGGVDPVTGKAVAEVREVEPGFNPDWDTDMFIYGLNTEDLDAVKRAAVTNGLAPASMLTVPGAGGDDLRTAVMMAMMHSNRLGLYDPESGDNPAQIVMAAMNSWGVNERQPLPDYKPEPTRLFPSEAELSLTIEDYFKSRVGRRPSTSEMGRFVQYLNEQYRLAYDQADMLAEREYYMDAAEGPDSGINPFYLTPEQQARLVQPATGEIAEVNPAAEFKRYFDQTMQPAIRASAEQQQAIDLRDSILGTLSMIRGER